MHLLRDAAARWLAGLGVAEVRLNVAPENLTSVRLSAKHGALALNEYFRVWEDIRALLAIRLDAGEAARAGCCFPARGFGLMLSTECYRSRDASRS